MPPKRTKMSKIPPELLYLIEKQIRKRSKPTRKTTTTPRKARSNKGIKRSGVKRTRKR